MHHIPKVAYTYRPQWLVMITKRVHVNQPGRWKEQREHVTQRHRHQDYIRWCAHVPLTEHHHYQRVEDDCDDEKERHDVAVHRDGIRDWHLAGDIDVAKILPGIV